MDSEYSPSCKTRYSSGSSSSESFGLIPPPPDSDDDNASETHARLEFDGCHRAAVADSLSDEDYDHSHKDEISQREHDKSINRIDFPNPRYNRSFISEGSKRYVESSGQNGSIASNSSGSKRCCPKEHNSSHSTVHTASSSRSTASRGQTTAPRTARSEYSVQGLQSITSDAAHDEKDESLINDLFDLLPENQSPLVHKRLSENESISSSDSGHKSTLADSSDITDLDEADQWSLRLGLQSILTVSSIFAMRCAVDHWKCSCAHERRLGVMGMYLQSLGIIDRISIQVRLRVGFHMIVSLIDSLLATLKMRPNLIILHALSN